MMSTQTLLNIAGILQAAVQVISLLAYLPQWKKLIDTKSSKDLSLRSWSIWIISPLNPDFPVATTLKNAHDHIRLGDRRR